MTMTKIVIKRVIFIKLAVAILNKDYFINLGAITLPSNGKHPMFKWEEFQSRYPTEEEYANFEKLFNTATDIQIICGPLYFNGKPTGTHITVYDLDNEPAIREFCNFNGKPCRRYL